jgi:hypothetical protein
MGIPTIWSCPAWRNIDVNDPKRLWTNPLRVLTVNLPGLFEPEASG